METSCRMVAFKNVPERTSMSLNRFLFPLAIFVMACMYLGCASSPSYMKPCLSPASVPAHGKTFEWREKGVLAPEDLSKSEGLALSKASQALGVRVRGEMSIEEEEIVNNGNVTSREQTKRLTDVSTQEVLFRDISSEHCYDNLADTTVTRVTFPQKEWERLRRLASNSVHFVFECAPMDNFLCSPESIHILLGVLSDAVGNRYTGEEDFSNRTSMTMPRVIELGNQYGAANIVEIRIRSSEPRSQVTDFGNLWIAYVHLTITVFESGEGTKLWSGIADPGGLGRGEKFVAPENPALNEKLMRIESARGALKKSAERLKGKLSNALMHKQ